MKYAPIVTLALAAAFVAGCGGGSSITQEEHDALQQELDAAKEAERLAEEARLRAEREAANERDRANQAEGQLEDEQTARQEAEDRADDLEEEAGHTASQLVQANARQVYAGLTDYMADPPVRIGTADPSVTPRHGTYALVTTTPSVTFSSITPGTSGMWRQTSFSHRGGTYFDQLDVYTDAEAPTSVAFKDSTYNTAGTITAKYNPGDTSPDAVVDNNVVVGSVNIGTANRSDASSPSSFPRSGAPAKVFDQRDRGEFDAARRNDETYTDDDTAVAAGTATYRDMTRYPLRYTAEVGGTLGGASGTFTCASASETACRVTNQNNHFNFEGAWVFTPSSATSAVRVNDDEYMWFGWWARQTNEDGTWDFQTFHGPMETGADGNRSTAAELDNLSGTATYKGPAVGQFSFYQPLTGQSAYGAFKAKATLRANFDNDMTDGTIDQFENHPDWTLTLKHGAIAATTGQETNGVSWQIDGEAVAAPDSGSWEAAFYSNLPQSQRTGTGTGTEAVPTGMAGTFEAAYHNVGRIIGAFGAHKQP